MTSYGDGAKQIWGTEFGYPTGGQQSMSEQTQADYVNPTIDTWYSHSFAGPLLWYCGRDSGTSAIDREDHFGLLRYDGSAKPAYLALAARLGR
jgi:hypothetical protein